MKHVKLIGTSPVAKYAENISPFFNWANKPEDTRDNIFQGKLEPFCKKQVIEKHFTPDKLGLVLDDSLEKEFSDKNRLDQYWILNSNILNCIHQTSRYRIMDSFTIGTVYYCSFGWR